MCYLLREGGDRWGIRRGGEGGTRGGGIKEREMER